MGQCISSGAVGEAARAAAAPRDTALVLLPAGELREYPRPATAARVLEDASGGAEGNGGGSWFLCDADRMGFEGPVAAVPAAEELRAGQIYFVLPAAARRRGLSREEVAALAVRASAALSKAAAAAAATANGSGSAGGRRRRGAVAPLLFAPPEEEQEVSERTFSSSFKVAPPPRQLKRRPSPRPGRWLERFASDLTAIPECEMSSE